MQSIVKVIYIFFLSIIVMSCINRGNENQVLGQEITANKIIKELNSGKDIYIEGAVIDGDIDFRTLDNLSKENQNLKCRYVHQSLCFVNCTFTGKIIMSGAGTEDDFIKTCFLKGVSFKNCIFKSDVIAANCEFRGVVDFCNSIFESKADFVGVYFANKDVFFTETSFNGEAQFSNSKFNGNVNFYKAFFNKYAYWQNVIIDGNTNIADCVFASYADFSSSSFKGILNFNYTKFRENAIMNYISFFGRVDFVQTVFAKKNEITNCEFHSLCRFSGTEFLGITKIENNVFVSQHPEVKNLKKSEDSEIIFTNNRFASYTEMSKFEFN